MSARKRSGCGFTCGYTYRCHAAVVSSQRALLMTDSTPSLRTRKRLKLQFGIGTLLLVTAAISLWLAVYFSGPKRAERAARSLQQSGADVLYDYQRTGDASYSMRVEEPGPPVARKLLGEGLFQEADSVRLGGRAWTADELRPLAQLTSVRSVDLSNSALGDGHLVHLAGLRQLARLGLSNNRITDEGLSHLAGLTQLEIVSLSKNRIHGDGLRHFAAMEKLNSLFLQDNPINDEG